MYTKSVIVFTFILFNTLATNDARSLLHIISDVMTNDQDIQTSSGVSSLLSSSPMMQQPQQEPDQQLLENDIHNAEAFSSTEQIQQTLEEEENEGEKLKNDIELPNTIFQHLRQRRETNLQFSSAEGHCPVVPDVHAYVNNEPVFLDFHWNEQAPSPQPDQDRTCPKDKTNSWWPHEDIHAKNLRASCPWIWVDRKMFDESSRFEVYPKYVQEAQCLCQSCVNANEMGCQSLRREQFFFKKIGCDGEHPVFRRVATTIKVGCFCAM